MIEFYMSIITTRKCKLFSNLLWYNQIKGIKYRFLSLLVRLDYFVQSLEKT